MMKNNFGYIHNIISTKKSNIIYDYINVFKNNRGSDSTMFFGNNLIFSASCYYSYKKFTKI